MSIERSGANFEEMRLSYEPEIVKEERRGITDKLEPVEENVSVEAQQFCDKFLSLYGSGEQRKGVKTEEAYLQSQLVKIFYSRRPDSQRGEFLKKLVKNIGTGKSEGKGKIMADLNSLLEQLEIMRKGAVYEADKVIPDLTRSMEVKYGTEGYQSKVCMNKYLDAMDMVDEIVVVTTIPEDDSDAELIEVRFVQAKSVGQDREVRTNIHNAHQGVVDRLRPAEELEKIEMTNQLQQRIDTEYALVNSNLDSGQNGVEISSEQKERAVNNFDTLNKLRKIMDAIDVQYVEAFVNNSATSVQETMVRKACTDQEMSFASFVMFLKQDYSENIIDSFKFVSKWDVDTKEVVDWAQTVDISHNELVSEGLVSRGVMKWKDGIQNFTSVIYHGIDITPVKELKVK